MIVRAANAKDLIVSYQEVAGFSVVGDLTEYGYKGEFLTWALRSTPVVVPYEWRLPDGTTASVALNRPALSCADHISPKTVDNLLTASAPLPQPGFQPVHDLKF